MGKQIFTTNYGYKKGTEEMFYYVDKIIFDGTVIKDRATGSLIEFGETVLFNDVQNGFENKYSFEYSEETNTLTVTTSQEPSDELLNQIISELDSYARDVDKREYGLPEDEANLVDMRQILRKFLNK